MSPIDVLSGATLGYQAAADLTDALTKLDPALSTPRFPIADGTAFVRPVVLRNLAPEQALVLLIFDNYPDKEQDDTFQFLGVVYAVTSPFGFNGPFWYVRGTVSF